MFFDCSEPNLLLLLSVMQVLHLQHNLLANTVYKSTLTCCLPLLAHAPMVARIQDKDSRHNSCKCCVCMRIEITRERQPFPHVCVITVSILDATVNIYLCTPAHAHICTRTRTRILSIYTQSLLSGDLTHDVTTAQEFTATAWDFGQSSMHYCWAMQTGSKFLLQVLGAAPVLRRIDASNNPVGDWWLGNGDQGSVTVKACTGMRGYAWSWKPGVFEFIIRREVRQYDVNFTVLGERIIQFCEGNS